jgi:hypothetical protein
VTLRNRVQPDGQITDVAMRGMFTGNRGILHSTDKIMGPALWKHRAWICCTLNWQERRRDVMTGRNWTELFSLMKPSQWPPDTAPAPIVAVQIITRFQMLGVVS